MESDSEEEQEDSSSDSEAEETDLTSTKTRSSSTLISKLLSKLSISSSEDQIESQSTESIQEMDELEDSASLNPNSGIPRSPLYWFVSSSSTPSSENSIKLDQTQLGVYRSLFPFPSSEELENDKSWHSKTLNSIQAGHFISSNPHSRNSKTPSAKRLKGSGIQDSAIPLGLVVVDGRNLLKSMGLTQDIEEEEEDGSESDSSFEEVETESSSVLSSSTQFTSSPNDGLLIPPPTSNPRTFTIILFGGGHFAASIIALPLSYTPPTKKGVSEKGVMVLASKTFHRYTTRRKQGGAQSAQDGSGSFAKSAGASLRRAGEAALKEEVRELLNTRVWRKLLGDTERVFVQGGGREAKGMIWNWENTSGGKNKFNEVTGSPLEEARRDGRVQSIPFVTKRPTLSECLRVFFELTRVKITRKSQEELRIEDENYWQLLRGGKKGERERERLEGIKKRKEEEKLKKKQEEERKLKEKIENQKVQLSLEEIRRRDRFERLVEIVRKGKLGAMIDLLGKYEKDLFRKNGDWEKGEIIGKDEEEVVDEEQVIAWSRERINSPLPTWWRVEQSNSDPKSKSSTSNSSINGESPSLTGMSGSLIPNTLLQLASEIGDEEILKYLLIERRADPTISITPISRVNFTSTSTSEEPSYPHRTAYDLLPSKSSRNLFRRTMALNPDWYAWDSMTFGGARVPAPLSLEKENVKKEKMKDRRNMLREKAKAREASKPTTPVQTPTPVKVEEEKKEVKSNPSRNRLGGSGAGLPNALRNRRDEDAGLTPEMKLRIEREKRARAAEARLKGLAGK